MLNVFLQMIIENTVIPEMNATIYLYKTAISKRKFPVDIDISIMEIKRVWCTSSYVTIYFIDDVFHFRNCGSFMSYNRYYNQI